MYSFKDWLRLREQRNPLSEDWTQAGIEIGNVVSTPEGWDGVKSFFKKVEDVVGMKKFISSVPKTVAAQIMFVLAVMKFSKNPTNMEALANVVKRLSEATKLGVYSGATIPLGAVIGNAVMPGGGAVAGGIIAKAISYGYFYMGQWADNNIDHPKFGEFAKKIQALMPKSMKHHDEPDQPKKPWYRKIF